MNFVTLLVSLATVIVWTSTTESVVSVVHAQNMWTNEAATLQQARPLVRSNNPQLVQREDHRALQTDKRVKVFQETDHIVVIEAESVDRRRFVIEDDDSKMNVAEASTWKFESNNTPPAIPDYVGSGYLRFSNKNLANTSAAITALTTSLTYYINITNPGEYRLSLRSYKFNVNPTTSFCDVQIVNFPGGLGSKVKAFLPGRPKQWNYRTLIQQYNDGPILLPLFNENLEDNSQIPKYIFPRPGTYRFVISGRMNESDYILDRLIFYEGSKISVNSAEGNFQPQSPYILTKPPPNAWPKLTVPPTLPLLPPYFLSQQHSPEYLFDTGTVDETTIYNDTTMKIYGASKIYENSQNKVIVIKEWAYPFGKDGHMFYTHRSGGLNFAYEFSNLYPPGTLVNVTLGFMENYPNFCQKQGRRIFNVTVNGKEYVSSLDVYGTIGCNVALLLSKEFQINKSGKIVISFKSVIQNPMIALIGIDNGESSKISTDFISASPSLFLSDVPTYTATNVPSDAQSSFIPSETPSDASSDLSSTLPSNVQSDNFSNVPSNVPSITSTSLDKGSLVDEDSVSAVSSSDQPSSTTSDAPSNVSSDAPSDLPSDLSSATPSDAPSDVSSDAPSDLPSDLSSATPSDSPSDVSSDAPSDSPSDLSSATPSDSPSDVSSDAPSDSPSDSASNIPSNFVSVTPSTDKELSNVPSDAPSEFPSDTRSESPSDVPSPAPRPIVSLSLVEAESGAVVATIHDGDVIERTAIGLNANLTIVAETLDVVETVRFGYDGITHKEGVAPYAMFGKLFNGNKFWPVQYLSTNGLKLVTVDAYDITYTKSIDEVVVTFTIV